VRGDVSSQVEGRHVMHCEPRQPTRMKLSLVPSFIVPWFRQTCIYSPGKMSIRASTLARSGSPTSP
jgi:hypothetical protein